MSRKLKNKNASKSAGKLTALKERRQTSPLLSSEYATMFPRDEFDHPGDGGQAEGQADTSASCETEGTRKGGVDFSVFTASKGAGRGAGRGGKTATMQRAPSRRPPAPPTDDAPLSTGAGDYGDDEYPPRPSRGLAASLPSEDDSNASDLSFSIFSLASKAGTLGGAGAGAAADGGGAALDTAPSDLPPPLLPRSPSLSTTWHHELRAKESAAPAAGTGPDKLSGSYEEDRGMQLKRESDSILSRSFSQLGGVQTEV